MFGLGFGEMLILGIIGVLLFGKNLPSVGRQLGQGIIEFKKGLNGLQYDIRNPDQVVNTASDPYRSPDDYEEPTAPRFEPPTSAPVIESTVVDGDSENNQPRTDTTAVGS